MLSKYYVGSFDEKSLELLINYEFYCYTFTPKVAVKDLSDDVLIMLKLLGHEMHEVDEGFFQSVASFNVSLNSLSYLTIDIDEIRIAALAIINGK